MVLGALSRAHNRLSFHFLLEVFPNPELHGSTMQLILCVLVTLLALLGCGTARAGRHARGFSSSCPRVTRKVTCRPLGRRAVGPAKNLRRDHASNGRGAGDAHVPAGRAPP